MLLNILQKSSIRLLTDGKKFLRAESLAEIIFENNRENRFSKNTFGNIS